MESVDVLGETGLGLLFSTGRIYYLGSLWQRGQKKGWIFRHEENSMTLSSIEIHTLSLLDENFLSLEHGRMSLPYIPVAIIGGKCRNAG